MSAASLLAPEPIPGPPEAFLARVGEVFRVFDRQDSGHRAYGVRCGRRRFFVKTVGPAGSIASRERRAGWLRAAARLGGRVRHPALPRVLALRDSGAGPVLVQAWVEGEVLRAPGVDRETPGSASRRFRALPAGEILRALDTIYDVHATLAAAGYVAVDFYDGSILYDFEARRLHLCDLDLYHEGPFVVEAERLPGSTRFMAPEEHRRGARIDQRTTVYTLGRCALVFLAEEACRRSAFRGGGACFAVVERACRSEPAERFASVAAFRCAWRAAREAGARPAP